MKSFHSGVQAPAARFESQPGKTFHALPGSIWALGIGSLFMDASSELVHSLLPLYMATVLGASAATIGIVEGIAEGTASLAKVFSGVLSDHLGRRKWLLVSGYGLSALTKPLFPLAGSVWWVFVGRFTDRIGKGIRGAPRDALVADIAPPALRGAAYGLRQSLDSVGAFVGPSLALLFMIWWDSQIRAVLWIAVAPAIIAVLVFIVAVREPRRAEVRPERHSPITLADLRLLSRGYWIVVLLGGVLTLARFSEAFLVLRAQTLGLTFAYVPAIMIVMNVVYAMSAYPAGIAADHLRPRQLLVMGILILLAADVVLATGATPAHAFLGSALWGLHMGMTQGLLAKLVADEVAERIRGTAFGIFNLVNGGALLLASVIAGAVWSAIGPSMTFMAGAAFAGTAAAGLMAYRPSR
jgi:MFS family permease